MEYEIGTYGYDIEFLKKNIKEVIILTNDLASIAVVPQYQGRVMTSTANGLSGKSFGWINYDLIASKEIQKHINAYGGEDRFWLGPEGGQFSIYFEKDAEFNSDNWFVPTQLDTEPFDLISNTNEDAVFSKKMELKNYVGTEFKLEVNRTIKLLQNESFKEILGQNIPDGVKSVGFQTENKITNIGNNEWTKETGALSIWILGMFTPTDNTVAALPYREGNDEELGKIVTSDYFGEISEDRLKIEDGVVFFKCDGKSRSKIGFSPLRAKPYAGSYDYKNSILTIANYILPQGSSEYVNSLWEIQDEPFKGDAVNSYNDGPMEDGQQLGPFYELETSSPAAFLKPGESMHHIHRTFHFVGDKSKLDSISQSLLGVSIDKFESVFNND